MRCFRATGCCVLVSQTQRRKITFDCSLLAFFCVVSKIFSEWGRHHFPGGFPPLAKTQNSRLFLCRESGTCCGRSSSRTSCDPRTPRPTSPRSTGTPRPRPRGATRPRPRPPPTSTPPSTQTATPSCSDGKSRFKDGSRGFGGGVPVLFLRLPPPPSAPRCLRPTAPPALRPSPRAASCLALQSPPRCPPSRHPLTDWRKSTRFPGSISQGYTQASGQSPPPLIQTLNLPPPPTSFWASHQTPYKNPFQRSACNAAKLGSPNDCTLHEMLEGQQFKSNTHLHLKIFARVKALCSEQRTTYRDGNFFCTRFVFYLTDPPLCLRNVIF